MSGTSHHTKRSFEHTVLAIGFIGFVYDVISCQFDQEICFEPDNIKSSLIAPTSKFQQVLKVRESTLNELYEKLTQINKSD